MYLSLFLSAGVDWRLTCHLQDHALGYSLTVVLTLCSGVLFLLLVLLLNMAMTRAKEVEVQVHERVRDARIGVGCHEFCFMHFLFACSVLAIGVFCLRPLTLCLSPFVCLCSTSLVSSSPLHFLLLPFPFLPSCFASFRAFFYLFPSRSLSCFCCFFLFSLAVMIPFIMLLRLTI